MRVLMVRPGPSFSVQDVAFGWRDGLRELGVSVGDFNFDDRLDFYCSAILENNEGESRIAFSHEQGVRLAAKGILGACFEFWPDIVLIVTGVFVPTDTLDMIRGRGIKVIVLCTESPYEDDRQLNFCQHADMVLLNDPINLDAFRAKNPESFYIPHAYDPARHHPGPALPDMVSDFAFVGTAFPSRVEFLEKCDLDGLDVILGGSWVSLPDESPLAPLVAHRRDWCMDNQQTADLYRSTRSSLNLYRRESTGIGLGGHEGVALGPREIELAACGTFFLRDPRPEGDEVFPMLPTFTEPAEVRPLLDWWLTHDDARAAAVEAARAAIAHRTFVANAAWLLQHIAA